jgi:hypothetical protein
MSRSTLMPGAGNLCARMVQAPSRQRYTAKLKTGRQSPSATRTAKLIPTRSRTSFGSSVIQWLSSGPYDLAIESKTTPVSVTPKSDPPFGG